VAKADYKKWSDYNTELLLRSFTNRAPADEYDQFTGFGWAIDEHWTESAARFSDQVGYYMRRLESIRERLELIPISPEIAEQVSKGTTKNPSETATRVFVVHGHDVGARESTARLLERLGIQSVILGEQVNQGRTIIEKFEAHADVGFAVVLLTPDDLGAAKGDIKNPKPRARQNVILELGYFIAKLGRGRVCPLYVPGVELPSDLLGLAWVEMDAGGAWRWTLAREMKAAGLAVDLNNLV
jgi:predicted nucleotide-binding protein